MSFQIPQVSLKREIGNPPVLNETDTRVPAPLLMGPIVMDLLDEWAYRITYLNDGNVVIQLKPEEDVTLKRLEFDVGTVVKNLCNEWGKQPDHAAWSNKVVATRPFTYYTQKNPDQALMRIYTGQKVLIDGEEVTKANIINALTHPYRTINSKHTAKTIKKLLAGVRVNLRLGESGETIEALPVLYLNEVQTCGDA